MLISKHDVALKHGLGKRDAIARDTLGLDTIFLRKELARRKHHWRLMY